MTRKDIVNGFTKFRERLGKWFENIPEDYEPQGVTWEHYEEGFKAGYEKRKQEELEEMMDAL